jgi:hypothetical protein
LNREDAKDAKEEGGSRRKKYIIFYREGIASSVRPSIFQNLDQIFHRHIEGAGYFVDSREIDCVQSIPPPVTFYRVVIHSRSIGNFFERPTSLLS